MKAREELPGVNMTAMIDIVFQLIIFFILTVKMEENSINRNIRLAMAPHGIPVQKVDPRTIKVDVDKNGKIFINNTLLAPAMFESIIRKAVAESGQGMPIVVTADGQTKHGDVRRVLDACTRYGIYKISFAALKEKG